MNVRIVLLPLLVLGSCSSPSEIEVTQGTATANAALVSAESSSSASVPPSAASTKTEPLTRIDALAPVAPIPVRERPTEEEWAAAPAIESSEPSGNVPGCNLRRLGEWVRAGCTGFLSLSANIGLGTFGKDFWTETSALGGESEGWLVIRAKQGDDIAARIWRTGSKETIVRVTWPTNSAEPTEVTLGGPGTRMGRGLSTGQVSEQIPLIPKASSARPAAADWTLATNVNTAFASNRPKWCELRVLRDWVKLRCEGNMSMMGMVGFGKRGEDFHQVSGLDYAAVEVRLNRGMKARTSVFGGPGAYATLELQWPAEAKQPTVIRVFNGQ